MLYNYKKVNIKKELPDYKNVNIYKYMNNKYYSDMFKTLMILLKELDEGKILDEYYKTYIER